MTRRPLALAAAAVLTVVAVAGVSLGRQTTPANAAVTPLPRLLLVPTGDATQVLLVRSSRWATTTATLEGWQVVNGAWQRTLGPFTARVGRTGFSTNHREGDGASPAGVFTISEAFGLHPDPGTRLPYRSVGPNDWWVSDPASPLYNTWQTGAPDGRWDPSHGERLATHAPVGYRYAAVIDYNRSPVEPHAGSAIFLHVGTLKPTSGCVSIAEAAMVRVLRWLDPARSPRIAMGPEAWLLDPGTITASVRYGMRGEAVKVVQRALAQRNLLASVDGVFGYRTWLAVRAFQRSQGITASGLVGPTTATALGIWAP